MSAWRPFDLVARSTCWNLRFHVEGGDMKSEGMQAFDRTYADIDI